MEKDKIDSAQDVINEAINRYSPTAVLACFSGGHDSLVATHVSWPYFDHVLHVNTGIGMDATRQFVRDTCHLFGWSLIEQQAPRSYEEIVAGYGFPGPAQHSTMYNLLKGRALCEVYRRFHKLYSDDHVLFITGARSEESTRRMGYVEPIAIDLSYPHWIWVAPIHAWSKMDCLDYITTHALPRNGVVDKLHMSGECLCGAYAKPGERQWIKFWFPEVDAYLAELESMARAVGIPEPRCRWGWGNGTPIEQGSFLPLCIGCQGGASGWFMRPKSGGGSGRSRPAGCKHD